VAAAEAAVAAAAAAAAEAAEAAEAAVAAVAAEAAAAAVAAVAAAVVVLWQLAASVLPCRPACCPLLLAWPTPGTPGGSTSSKTAGSCP